MLTDAVILSAAMLLAQASAQSAGDLSTCRAGGLAGYVGKPYKRLQKVRPDARYVCSTCPMTMDFRADRLTVTYNARTRRVTRLRCV